MKENMIKWARVKEGANIPTKDIENAAYDVYACFEEDFLVLPSGKTTMIPTGIASALHSSKYIQIEERGSTGSIGMKYSCGVIDSNYRGEWFICIYNANNRDIIISKLTREELIEKYGKKTEDGICIPYTREEKTELGDKITRRCTSYIIDDFYPEDSALVYPYSKAVAQGVVHEVPVMETEVISYEELLKIESNRGTGMLGSTNK